MKKFLSLLSIISVCLMASLFSSCSTIQPDERGVLVKFGKIVSKEVEQPGMIFYNVFTTDLEKFSISPIQTQFELVAKDGNNKNAAVTKDMQSVGCNVVIQYKYDEARLFEVVQNYSDTKKITNALYTNAISSVKTVVGKYSIYDLIGNQSEITQQVSDEICNKTNEHYPITIVNVAITNWDWSDDFDRQINATMNRAQQVKQAEQDLKLAETNAQKQVAEAEAKKKAIEQNAEADLIKAQKDAEAELVKAQKAAEAKKVEADALAYYNNKVAQNYNVEIKLKELEIELERAKKWDGKEVPDYIPLTAAGGVVNVAK